MTHEHMDHVQGLLYASAKLRLELPVQRSWLTASAEPGYYTSHPGAERQKIAPSAPTVRRSASSVRRRRPVRRSAR